MAACPVRDVREAGAARYDRQPVREWRHLSWGRMPAWLRYAPWRVSCRRCRGVKVKVKVEQVPWASGSSVFTSGATPDDAPALLDEWLEWAARSRLTPFVKLGRTIRKHAEGILAYLDTKITNGPVVIARPCAQDCRYGRCGPVWTGVPAIHTFAPGRRDDVRCKLSESSAR